MDAWGTDGGSTTGGVSPGTRTAEEAVLTPFTFFLYEHTRAVPNFEIELLGSESDALQHARTLLVRHRHYATVGVFDGSRSITELSRESA